VSQTFIDDLGEKLKAGFQAFSLSTHEPRRALTVLADFGRQHKIPVVSWSSIHGLKLLFPLDPVDEDTADLKRAADLLRTTIKGERNGDLVGNAHGFLDFITNRRVVDRDPRELPARVMFVALDTHSYFAEEAPLRTRFVDLHSRALFVHQYEDPQTTWTVDFDHPVVFMQSVPGVHDEVDHLIEPLKLPLMTADEIAADCVDYIKAGLPADKSGLEGADGALLRSELAALCTGLYKHQVDDILSLAARHGGKLGFSRDSLRAVRDYRAELINQSGLLTVYKGRETFDGVGGLGALKDYLGKLLRPSRPRTIANPKGIMLVGVSGSGKTLVAQALGNVTDRTTIKLDVGDLLGGIVGQSEQQVKRALDIVDAAGKSILLIDEVEKALSGTRSSGQTDSGVMSRVFGKLLAWLNDHRSDCFVICTANDITQIPVEFARAERFDALYFLDVPSGPARRAMWDMYIAKYGLDPRQPLPADAQWTGAEIASACRQAYLLETTLREASRNIVPVVRRDPEVIARMRDWATKTGCINAEDGTPYGAQPEPAVESATAGRVQRRKIDPTAN
jgi:hypothetical protein